MQVNTPRARAAVAGLAALGLSASILAIGLATAPAAQAAGLSSVVINEVESNGDTANGDWIELYNNDSAPVDLTGAILSDSDNTHSLVLSGTIAAGGYATFRVDDPSTSGNFGLGGADSARLFAPGASPATATLIDSYSWTNHAATTYGRSPNGTGAFKTTSLSTRNASNVAPSTNPQPEPGSLKGVYINEVETQGDLVNGDWIELFNSTGDDVVLDGAVLADNNNGHLLTIPAGTTIFAGDYVTVITEDATGVGAFGLGDVDSARLYEAGTTDPALANAVDSYSWTTHPTNTYGRDWTDTVAGPWGTNVGRWKPTAARTYNAVNTFGGPVTDLAGKVVINEVESNGDVYDWVELRNNTTGSVTIAGAVISDSDNSHVFQIPTNTPALAAGGYVAFRVDDPAVDGSFGLGAADSARLFDAGDILGTDSPVDSYSWTSHASITYGRCPNGTGSFVNTLAGTRGAANSCA